MTGRHTRSAFGLGGVLLALALGSLDVPPARADEAEADGGSFIVSKWAYQRLNEAQELLTKRKYAEALEVMESMKGRRGLNAHEQTLTWQTIGYIYASQEKVKPAIDAFERCLALGAIPEGSLLDLQYNLGQLYMISEQYRKAVDTWTVWLGKAKKVSLDAKSNLAMALVKVKDYRRALGFAEELCSMARPKENHLQLLLSIHFQLKQKQAMLGVIKRLIALYPKKTYWMQLFAVYMELEDEPKALAVAQMAYQQGFLQSAGELNNLVSLLVSQGVPFEAAAVLEKGMAEGKIPTDDKSLQLLGDTWLRAGELTRAIPHLRKAAERAKSGEIYIRLAQVHVEREEFGLASEALRQALKKGGLVDPGNAHLLLGIALLRDKKTAAAKKAFGDARGFANTSRSAEQWLRIISQKEKEQQPS